MFEKLVSSTINKFADKEKQPGFDPNKVLDHMNKQEDRKQEQVKPLSDISNMPILGKFIGKTRDKLLGAFNLKKVNDGRH